MYSTWLCRGTIAKLTEAAGTQNFHPAAAVQGRAKSSSLAILSNSFIFGISIAMRHISAQALSVSAFFAGTGSHLPRIEAFAVYDTVASEPWNPDHVAQCG